jgi:hypothetical protein
VHARRGGVLIRFVNGEDHFQTGMEKRYKIMASCVLKRKIFT